MKPVIKNYFDGDALSPEQLIVGEWLSVPGRGGMTLEQIGEKVNVSARQIHRWRQDPRFTEYVRRRTMQNVSEHLPDVMETLTIAAKSGRSIKAIEVWLRANGLMQPEMVVRPAAPEDERSNEALEAEIERLSAELEAMDTKNQKEDDE